ncbi:MAG: hypothetical protein ACR2NM_02020 [Bythopirellula sp.]
MLLIFLFPIAATTFAVEFAAPRQVDERRAAQVGLRKIVGQHLRLYTDLPPSDAVDSLPVVFDAAVPLWAEYFRVDYAQLRNWRMQGFLIEDRAKFAALGLLPAEKPDFTTGYCSGNELWLLEQSSDYFRRHLLLHEGTHGFTYTQLGDTGPGWYMEGTAELFGTHRWQDGKLAMRVMPLRREDVPMWGRIRLVRDAVREQQPLDMRAILSLDKRRAFSTEEYSWTWALSHFLDSHPRWQQKFRNLPRYLNDGRFNYHFRNDYRTEWKDLLVEWQAFVSTLDYGYDTERMAMQHLPASRVTAAQRVTIAVDRGWQSTGWLLEAGRKYQLTATGRYQIARDRVDAETWPCEPGGVTIEYHEGRPLGRLLGSWRTAAGDQFSAPFSVGLAKTLTPNADATLYLRANDSPARLSENLGSLDASIRPVGD